MPRETPSPIDLPGERDPSPGHGWASMTIAFATIFLLLFNAVSLRDWAEALTPSPAQARLASAAEEWVAITDRVCIGTPRAWLHARWKQAEGAGFPPG